jgi:hypothetical protein
VSQSFIAMLSVVMLNVVMLNVVMLSIVATNFKVQAPEGVFKKFLTIIF